MTDGDSKKLSIKSVLNVQQSQSDAVCFFLLRGLGSP
jgi:hypothetical protein